MASDALWDGHLRNSVGDIVVDAIIAVCLIIAFGIQWLRLRSWPTTRGLSPYFLLFNAIYNNSQLSEALVSFGYSYPSLKTPVLDLIKDGRLRGFGALGGVFGFLHIFICWFFSIANVLTYAMRSPDSHRGWKGISVLAFFHASVVLLPILPTVTHKPEEKNMGMGIIIGGTTMLNEWVAPIFVLLQFYAQFRERTKEGGESGALSVLSLGLQVFAVGAVGVRWFMRLGWPAWKDGLAWPNVWYIWGFLAINCLIYAAGCAVLWYLYWSRPAKGNERLDHEYTPLLA